MNNLIVPNANKRCWNLIEAAVFNCVGRLCDVTVILFALVNCACYEFFNCNRLRLIHEVTLLEKE